MKRAEEENGGGSTENGGLCLFHPLSSILHPRILLSTLVVVSGCVAHQPVDNPTTRPTVQTRSPEYWIDLPATSSVESPDFDKLWTSCEQSARHFGFTLDRIDQRSGVITTVPLISKQFFEFWHNDVVTTDDLEKSSLATYRRTMRFEVSKREGGFVAAPCVVIERFSRAEQPIRASIYLQRAFRTDPNHQMYGTPESDRGIYLPRNYWYATGRDTELEKQAADEVRKGLARQDRVE